MSSQPPPSQDPKSTAASSGGSKNARDVRQQMLAGKRSGLEIIRQFLGWDMMPKWMRSKWFFGGSIGVMTFLILATDRGEGEWAVEKRMRQEYYEQSLKMKDQQRLKEVAQKNPALRQLADVPPEK
eukprot:TRINITY_DN15943_c0_g1_i1.p1 TRINITY_DN15943_c0_g1~~TRINITY_DN15943_c0_g1_i1.p1  ORF type:complete len:140 (-),score=19.76 TRINITY_DN15943_c0_g1_i1:102-479(-)